MKAWLTLSRRIYLGTSTLQTMYDYGETLWQSAPFESLPRDAKVSGLADEVDALHNIFMVNEVAQFEFAVTEASSREVTARNEWSRNPTLLVIGRRDSSGRRRILQASRVRVVPGCPASARPRCLR